MARVRNITRTIKGYEVTVEAYSTIGKDIRTITLTVSGVKESNKKEFSKALDAQAEALDLKVLEITDVTEVEKKYIMPEIEFLKHARPATAEDVEDEDTDDKEDA